MNRSNFADCYWPVHFMYMASDSCNNVYDSVKFGNILLVIVFRGWRELQSQCNASGEEGLHVKNCESLKWLSLYVVTLFASSLVLIWMKYPSLFCHACYHLYYVTMSHSRCIKNSYVVSKSLYNCNCDYVKVGLALSRQKFLLFSHVGYARSVVKIPSLPVSVRKLWLSSDIVVLVNSIALFSRIWIHMRICNTWKCGTYSILLSVYSKF